MNRTATLFLTTALGLAAGCAELQYAHAHPASQATPAPQAGDRLSFHELVERLEVLESLRARGLLTEREYQDAKQPLVDLLTRGDVLVSDDTATAAVRRPANDATSSAAFSYPSNGGQGRGYGQDH